MTDRHRQAWQRIYSRPIEGGPTTRGFDDYFGTDVPNWPPYCFIEGNRTLGIPTTFLPEELLRDHLASKPGPALEDWKLEGVLPALAARAEKTIAARAKQDRPFLLYLPLTSPHTPLAVNEPWRGKSGLQSAVADLIMETDDVVGRVLAALRDNGVEDQTLVVFTSDNGFAPYVGVRHLEEQGHFPSGPLRGYKGDAWEGGHRVPFVVRWPGVVKPARCATSSYTMPTSWPPLRRSSRQNCPTMRARTASASCRSSREATSPFASTPSATGAGSCRLASRFVEDALRPGWRRRVEPLLRER